MDADRHRCSTHLRLSASICGLHKSLHRKKKTPAYFMLTSLTFFGFADVLSWAANL